MSRYGDYDYDNISYELGEFLRDHVVSELLMLVTDAVERKEAEDENNKEKDCE